MAGGNPIPQQEMAPNPPVSGVDRADPSHMGETMQSEPAPQPEPVSSNAVPSDVADKIRAAGGAVPGVVTNRPPPAQAGGPVGGGMPGVKARLITGSSPAPRNPTPARGGRR